MLFAKDGSKQVKTLIVLIFYKFWWKIKSLSTVDNLVYKDVTPPREIFVEDSSFSVFTSFGCFISKYVGKLKQDLKRGRKKKVATR